MLVFHWTEKNQITNSHIDIWIHLSNAHSVLIFGLTVNCIEKSERTWQNHTWVYLCRTKAVLVHQVEHKASSFALILSNKASL